jgi:NAD-dependent SIR2 family protein deacetylase
MQRIIGLILLGLGVFALTTWLKRQNQRPHHKDTFRPNDNNQDRANHQTRANGKERETMSLVSKRQAAQMRDALTGSPINLEAKIWQCQNCQSLYHDDSVQALQRDNDGKCTQCQSTQRQQVVFIED